MARSDPEFWLPEVAEIVRAMPGGVSIARVAPKNGHGVKPGLYIFISSEEGPMRHVGPYKSEESVRRGLVRIGFLSRRVDESPFDKHRRRIERQNARMPKAMRDVLNR